MHAQPIGGSGLFLSVKAVQIREAVPQQIIDRGKQTMQKRHSSRRGQISYPATRTVPSDMEGRGTLLEQYCRMLELCQAALQGTLGYGYA